MKTIDFLNDLKKGKEAPIYTIIGDERFFEKKIIDSLVKKIPQNERQFNVGQYDMEEVPISQAIDDALSVPFLGDKRLVIIKNPVFLLSDRKKLKVEHDLTSFENYLKNPQPTTILVIFANYPKIDERKKISKLIKQKTVIVENKVMNEPEVRKYLSEILNKKGYSISKAGFEMLIQRTDAKISTIINELPKLLLVAKDTKKISDIEIERMVSKSLEQNVFDLVEIVLRKNIRKSIEMYHDLLQQGEAPLKINAILVTQFRIILQVTVLKDNGYAQGNIASVLKINPYRVKLALKESRSFKIDSITRAYLGLVEIEEQLKSKTVDPELLFQLFLMKFNNK